MFSTHFRDWEPTSCDDGVKNTVSYLKFQWTCDARSYGSLEESIVLHVKDHPLSLSDS